MHRRGYRAACHEDELPAPPRVPAAHGDDRRPGGGACHGAPARHARRRGGRASSGARRLPGPRNLPIDTFVVLMMENRSFDHYLGWLPGADGRQAGLTLRRHDGQPLRDAPPRRPTSRAAATPTPTTRGTAGARSSTAARCDGFLRSGDNDVFSIGYYAEGDLGFIPDAAQAFTTFDRFHCSLLALDAARTASTCTRRSPTAKATTRCRRRRSTDGLPGHDDLRRARARRASRTATSSTTCRWRRCGARPGWRARARRRSTTQRCASGHAAARLVRRPELRRQRRRGAGHVGRRAPARRRAHRPGVHGRRRARVHGVAAVEARRAVHRLRRVGRLLRPRRARRACPTIRNDARHQQGLRADGLPHPGGRRLARTSRRGHVDAHASTASSRS